MEKSFFLFNAKQRSISPIIDFSLVFLENIQKHQFLRLAYLVFILPFLEHDLEIFFVPLVQSLILLILDWYFQKSHKYWQDQPNNKLDMLKVVVDISKHSFHIRKIFNNQVINNYDLFYIHTHSENHNFFYPIKINDV